MVGSSFWPQYNGRGIHLSYHDNGQWNRLPLWQLLEPEKISWRFSFRIYFSGTEANNKAAEIKNDGQLFRIHKSLGHWNPATLPLHPSNLFSVFAFRLLECRVTQTFKRLLVWNPCHCLPVHGFLLAGPLYFYDNLGATTNRESTSPSYRALPHEFQCFVVKRCFGFPRHIKSLSYRFKEVNVWIFCGKVDKI